jgi:4'-phosphopantetheinyl transferase EntD
MLGPDSRLFPACARAAFSDGSDEPPPLPPVEAEAVQEAVPSRQREFALGRWCARRALDALGIDAPTIPLGARRAPRWPEGAVGSITHCRGFVGAVVAPIDCLNAIGFDAERAEPLDPDLIRLICTEPEVAWVRGLGDPNTDWPKVIFSAKEALHKCIWPGSGRTLDFLDVTLTFDSTRTRFTARAAAPESAVSVDLSGVQGRLFITGEFVYSCAFIEARSL